MLILCYSDSSSRKTQNESEEPPITEQEVEVAPASAAPCPAPSRTLRRKLGEFFTLKKRRAVKSEGSQEGKAKKTSIADLIRPLREATRAEKDQVKENEKVKEKESVDDSFVTGDPVEAETPPDGPTPLRGEALPRRALREGKSQSLILLSGSAANTGNTKNTAQGKVDVQMCSTDPLKQFDGLKQFGKFYTAYERIVFAFILSIL